MLNFCLMLNVLFFNDPADERSVGKKNEGYDNCYGNNYKNEKADI